MQCFSVRNTFLPYLSIAYSHRIKELAYNYKNYWNRNYSHKRKPPVHNKKKYADYYQREDFYNSVLSVCCNKILQLCGVA